MADNIADVVLPAGWVSAYAVSGIAQGKGLIIQNKSDIFVLGYQVGPKPADTDVNGYLIAPLATVWLDGGDDRTGTYSWSVIGDNWSGVSSGHTHQSMTGETATESAHKHYFTSDSINGNVTQTDFLPMYLALGKFIYLGL